MRRNVGKCSSSGLVPASHARAPWHFPGNEIVIGYAEDGRAVVLTPEDRARHVYIPGRTGSGKSRLLSGMIRQDIGRNPTTGCPVVVFDLHGELVKGILNAASCDLRYRDLPIVSIDLTDRENVIKWNPLKQKCGIDHIVAARQMAEAVMHASGSLNLMQAPTLQRTMTTFFHVAIERRLAMSQLFALMDSGAHALRAAIARELTDVRTRADLERMNALSKQRLEEELLALHNRLATLTATPILRRMMGDVGAGFDFGWALDAGAIVLVNLATSGGTLTETDARVVASLMLTELWQAAQARGKGAEGERQPCYVYIDEAPFIATLTLGLHLAQARGFGLHLTLAAQATSQFEDFGGEHGRAVRKAVLRDTLTKIVLAQTAEEDDIVPLARELALAYYDPLLRKHTTVTTQVVGEEREEYWTIARNRTSGTTEGSNAVVADAKTRGRSSSRSSTTNTGGVVGMSYTIGTSDGSITPELLAAEVHPGHTSHTDTESWTTSNQDSWSESEAESESEHAGTTHTRARGRNRSYSVSEGETDTQHVRWRPIFEKVENPQFFTFDEQMRMWEKKLFTFHPRHALVSRQGQLAVEIATPTVRDPVYVDPNWVIGLLEHLRARQTFWTTASIAPPAAEAPIVATPAVTRLGSYSRRGSSPKQPVDHEEV